MWPRMQVGRMLKLGALWAIGSQIAVYFIRFGSVIVLARLLTPDDYGAASLAITLGSFAFILGDLGYGNALVQASTATQRRASTAYWAALAAGVVGTSIAALGAYPAALALHEPEVTALVAVGGLSLVLVALGSTSNALLTRSMSFSVIQSASLVATLVAAGAAVALAAAGAGAWALVVQQVVLAALMSALFIVAARWRPSFEFSRPAFRSLSKFALPVTGGHVFGVVQPLVTALLIGALVGVEELGIWSLSMAIVVVPLSLFGYPIARVIYAAFARMREDRERVAEVWLTGLTLLAAVVLPSLFGLIAVAPDLVPLMFGSQWGDAVHVVQILGVFIMARTLQTWNTPVMDAFGKPQVSTILNATVLIALVPSIWIGSRFGIEGVAIAFSLAALVCGELPSFVITTRALSLSGMSVLRRLLGLFVSSAAACVAVVLLRRTLEDGGMGVELRVVMSIVAGAAVYIGCIAIFARTVARDLVRMARDFLPGLRPSS